MYIYIYIYIYVCIHNIYYISVHVWEDFLPKNIFTGKIYGEELLYMDELMTRSCQGRGSFMNAFYNNLNTANLFPNHAGIFT